MNNINNNNNNEPSIKTKGLVIEQYAQTKQFKVSKYPLNYYNSSKSINAFSTNTIRRRTSRSNGRLQLRKNSKHARNADKSPMLNEGHPTNTSSGTYIAKAIIERALQKIDGVLSDFTEKTITKSDADEGVHIPFERVGNGLRQAKNRPRSSIQKSNDQKQQTTSSGRLRKSDLLSKLPPHIIDLMRMDSNSSVTKSKDRKYHTRKMTLKQAGNTGQGSYTHTPKFYSKSFKIAIVSTPLQLEREDTTKTEAQIKNGKTHETYKLVRWNSKDFVRNNSATQKQKGERQALSTLALNKNDKNIGTGGPSYMSSVKKILKSQIGVENGVAFVMGTKMKQQFYNSFGEAKDYGRDPSNRKWVLSVGSFQDNEIFELIDDTLKIKGCCQPTMNHPDGQTDYVMFKIPPDLDFNSLRVYRSANTHEFLILEEIWKKSHTLKYID
ncbi:hypothetical protein Ocin01_17134 [Orchesella cincta]|uniref:Uncharacterized protein n=1 Tax=Orchesella cincta TaxID=48709 RepID=A0A1D2M9A2_ORCCI|nr:hypothetical protein Ocin01_17134 [Orchesella cincta]